MWKRHGFRWFCWFLHRKPPIFPINDAVHRQKSWWACLFCLWKSVEMWKSRRGHGGGNTAWNIYDLPHRFCWPIYTEAKPLSMAWRVIDSGILKISAWHGRLAVLRYRPQKQMKRSHWMIWWYNDWDFTKTTTTMCFGCKRAWCFDCVRLCNQYAGCTEICDMCIPVLLLKAWHLFCTPYMSQSVLNTHIDAMLVTAVEVRL